MNDTYDWMAAYEDPPDYVYPDNNESPTQLISKNYVWINKKNYIEVGDRVYVIGITADTDKYENEDYGFYDYEDEYWNIKGIPEDSCVCEVLEIDDNWAKVKCIDEECFWDYDTIFRLKLLDLKII